MRNFKMPTAYTVLFGILLLMTILTWVIPSGQYEYSDSGEPIAGSYHRVENAAQAATVRVTSDAFQVEPLAVAAVLYFPILAVLLWAQALLDRKKK